MGLNNPFKLEKLTITAFEDNGRKQQIGQPFVSMFNPETYSQKYAISYGKGINGGNVNFAFTKLPSLSLKLILDGTGSQEVTTTTDDLNSVAVKVETLLKIGFDTKSKFKEPNFLEVTWGKALRFQCRMSSIDINYTSFSPDGTPLRAELNIELLSDESVNKKIASKGKQTPDLARSRTVNSGDNITLLSKKVYGSSSNYLAIAKHNQLDNFRNLVPGQRLIFPPLP